MTKLSFSIFDAYGHVRPMTEADAPAIAALSEEENGKFFAVIEACQARDDGQERVRVARADVRAKEAVVTAAHDAEVKANPSATHKQALEAAVAAQAGRKPEVVRVNKKTRNALAEANLALAEARIELQHATTEGRALEIKSGFCIDAWRRCLTTPSDAEVRQAYVKADTDARMKRVQAGLPADVPPPVTNQSPLEMAMAARGKQNTNRLPVYYGKR
jgi:hypothetical protein